MATVRIRKNIILTLQIFTIWMFVLACDQSNKGFSLLEESKSLIGGSSGALEILGWSPEEEVVIIPSQSGKIFGITVKYDGNKKLIYTYELNGKELGSGSQPFFNLKGSELGSGVVTFTAKVSDGTTTDSHSFQVKKNQLPTMVSRSPADNLAPVDCGQSSKIFSAEFADPDGHSLNYTWLIDGIEADDDLLTEVKNNRARAVVSYDCNKAVDHTLTLFVSDGIDQVSIPWRYLKQENADTGTVGNSAISYNPVSYDFGFVAAYSGLSTTTIAATNSATKPIYFTGFTGENAHFKILSHNCPLSPTPWATGSSCNVTLKFSPQGPGAVLMNLQGNYKSAVDSASFFSLMGISGVGVSPLRFDGVQSTSEVRHNKMTLNWNTTADASAFLVFRVVGGDLIYQKTVVNAAGAITSTTVTGLTPNTSYTFRVRATDVFGNQDTNTADATRTTATNRAPAITFPTAYSFYSGTTVGPIDASDANTGADIDQDDDAITYTCQYTDITGAATGTCSTLVNEGGGNPSFNATTGVFSGWKPLHAKIGSNYKIDITGTDPYAASSTFSVTKTILQGIPTVPTISGISSSRANSRNQTVTGTADPNGTVVLYYGANCATSLASGTANGSGNFSINITTPAVDGSYVIRGKGLNVIGNYSDCSTTSVTFVLDATPPTPLSLYDVDPDSPASDLTPTLYGISEAAATVNLYKDSSCATVVATTTVAGNGTFSFTSNVNAYSTTTFYVRAVDDLGNITSCGTLGTYLTYVSFRVPTGVAWMQGDANTASTYLNPRTASPLVWNRNQLYDPDYYHYSSSAPEKIELNYAGDYLITVHAPLSMDINPPAGKTIGVDASTRIQVYVNGNAINTAIGESLISNLNSHQQAHATLNLVLPNLAVGDIITVRSEATSGRGTFHDVTGTAHSNVVENIFITPTHRASVYLEHLDSTRKVFAAKATSVQGGSTNIHPAAAAELEWATNHRTHTAYSHSTSVAPNEITINQTGSYLVFLNVPILSNAASYTSPRLEIRLDGVIKSSAMQGFSRYITGTNANRHIYQSVHWAGLVEATAGQKLTVSTIRDTTVNTTVNIFNGAELYVEQISTASKAFLATATQTSDGTNANNWNPTTAANVLWSTNTIKDATIYEHSTSTNAHQIMIKERADYVLVFNDSFAFDCAALGGRVNPLITLKKNGATVSGAEIKSHFISDQGNYHCRSSGSMVFFLQDLKVNDVLSFTTQAEASGTGLTTTYQPAQLLLLQK